MSSLRWVFIRPRHESPYYDPEIQEPLGLEYLSASRREKGDAVLVLDALLESMDDHRLARRAVSFRPDFIGISIMTARELASVQAIFAECQKALAGREVCWLAGGNFISHEAERAIEALPDGFYLVRFEGENALEVLARQWTARSPREACDKAPPSRIIVAAPVADLQALPFPERPFACALGSERGAFNIQGSRGCLGACRYCSSPEARSLKGHQWRGRPMEHIVAEMDELNRRYGAVAFNFIDEDFLGPNTLATERARQFAAGIERRGLSISFSIQVRPDSLSREIIELLAASGLSYAFIGVESDNREDFKRWGRPWTGPPWDLVAHLRRLRVEVGAGVLLFHPHSTLQGIKGFAEVLHRHQMLNYRTAINRLDAMPGSRFHQDGIAAGVLQPIAGPQRLPFVDAGLEALYDQLTTALSPLGPVSMHAVCSLPAAVARHTLLRQSASAYQALKGIIGSLDGAVAETLFVLLGQHAAGKTGSHDIRELRLENLAVSLAAARELVSLGMAPSVDQLREAIRMDAGI